MGKIKQASADRVTTNAKCIAHTVQVRGVGRELAAISVTSFKQEQD